MVETERDALVDAAPVPVPVIDPAALFGRL
ncbi:MAG: hypothetical protein JWM05_3726 [Acidimicrobiales bacterium]|nr:hypothetical protein [Acidimicrobiales bacterium]